MHSKHLGFSAKGDGFLVRSLVTLNYIVLKEQYYLPSFRIGPVEPVFLGSDGLSIRFIPNDIFHKRRCAMMELA